MAAPPAAGALKINETESSAAASGPDFVELINNGPAADIGGYLVKDNDDTHTFTIAPGTTIAAGGYYVAETDALPGGFGLGSADSVGCSLPMAPQSWTATAGLRTPS